MPKQNQDEEYLLINSFETTVEATVRRLIKEEPGMCQCEKCFLDVCALVYNEGFAHFVTTRKGELLARVPDIIENKDVELLVVALKAIEKVKDHPIH